MSEQFKVGDVVVLNKLNAVHHGQIGLVTDVNGERCRVKFPDDEIHFNSEYLRRPTDNEMHFWRGVGMMSDVQLYLVEKLWEYQKDAELDRDSWQQARRFVKWMLGIVDDSALDLLLADVRDGLRSENEEKMEEVVNGN